MTGLDGQFHTVMVVLQVKHKPNRIERFGVSYLLGMAWHKPLIYKGLEHWDTLCPMTKKTPDFSWSAYDFGVALLGY